MYWLSALVALALTLSLLTGGSLAALARQRVRWWPAALAALVVQLVLYSPPAYEQPWALAWGPLVGVASMAVVLAVLARNALERGVTARSAMAVAAAGVGLNLVVMGFNGGYMPRTDEPPPSADQPAARLRNVRALDEHTRLPWLGDVIRQPEWLPRSGLVSAGDLLLFGGIAAWAAMAARDRAAQPEASRR